MSSPLANSNRSFVQKKLIQAHQVASHNHRIRILSKHIAVIVQSLPLPGKSSLLDIGCGDMQLLYAIKTLLPQVEMTGLDIYKLPDALQKEPYWSVYRHFDGRSIPLPDKAVWVALLVDVLHHLPEQERLNLLREAGRVAEYVIIKDHFEYGFFSRHMLRLMDFAGNWAYGVSVPQRYFTMQQFQYLTRQAGMKEMRMLTNIELYNHNPVLKYLLQSKWQFIYAGKSEQ